jgi:membrane protein insertase Oxa1/YidC/SpoIIIJ
MSFVHFIYQLIIEPLVVLFEYVYAFSCQLTGDSALALIPLSLAVNFLCLPLYRRADAIRLQNREKEKQMEGGLKHIRAQFKGDERFLMTQAYYRLNGYKPIYVLRNSLSLLLQSLFFIAAYVMLSNRPEFQEKSFGFISNLGAPDNLLVVEGLFADTLTVNLLPILMTLINLVSGVIYGRRGGSRSDKIQVFVLALIFLVLLYDSPAGLVLYWILNQLFSLGKNLVDVLWRKPAGNMADNMSAGLSRRRDPALTLSFLLGGAVLAVLTGALIPSTVIRSSVHSFVYAWDYHSPLLHVANALLVAVGTFTLWTGVFYGLAGQKGRRVLAAAMWCLSGAALTDYMFFGKNAGTLQYTLVYETPPSFPMREIIVNILVLAAVVALFIVIWKKWEKVSRPVLAITLLVTAGMSLSNCMAIGKELPQLKKAAQRHVAAGKATIPLSRNGSNVIVLMLDRAISIYIPYLFEEKPELKEKFDGFTYYPNTLTFGGATNTATPALFGGYEYAPEKMNERDGEWLKDKHDEALRVMPRLFCDHGFTVTVCDPPYAGYQEPPDLSIFDDYPSIRAFNTGLWQPGIYSFVETVWEKNFFCYSLMKTVPLAMQGLLYQDGQYSNDSIIAQNMDQFCSNPSLASGVRASFLDNYAILCELPDMTRIEDTGDTFLMMVNNTTHEPMLLKEPEYEPAKEIDNTAYDQAHRDRFTIQGRTLPIESVEDMQHYHTNMAALLRLGAWFDYMREEGLYDNTRIILVSDHGKKMFSIRNPLLPKELDGDIFQFNPLLLVKDFNDSGFKVDYRFMTNADTPALALDSLIVNPINPATGNPINSDAKMAGELHIGYVLPGEWNVSKNHGKRFNPMRWASLKNQNVFDANNWEYIGYY